MNIRKTFSFFLCLSLAQLAVAQIEAVSFEQVDSLQQVEARPVVVFIYTDWCRYCHRMEQQSWSSEQVIALLNEQYYFVRLHAEEEKTIHFREHDFEFRPSGVNTGTHQLAEALATIDGQLAYPTTCILNAQYEIVFQYGGFMAKEELAAVLQKLANGQ